MSNMFSFFSLRKLQKQKTKKIGYFLEIKAKQQYIT